MVMRPERRRGSVRFGAGVRRPGGVRRPRALSSSASIAWRPLKPPGSFSPPGAAPTTPSSPSRLRASSSVAEDPIPEPPPEPCDDAPRAEPGATPSPPPTAVAAMAAPEMVDGKGENPILPGSSEREEP